MRILVALFFSLCIVFGLEASKIAKSDRSLWSYPINSPSSFDFASKMEMLVFVEWINKIEALNEANLKAFLKIDSISLETINKFLKNSKEKIALNFKNASLVDKNDFLPQFESYEWEDITNLSKYAKENLPKELSQWRENADIFYQHYIYEQLRLAAIFPRITSEILTLDENEIKGDRIKDKNFILTFDDGPTKIGGNTDKLIKLLRDLNVKAIFFVLDSSLKNRGNDSSKIYDGFIVGSHGEFHKPHIKKEIYQNAPKLANKVKNLGINKDECFFRPPYGQRNIDIVLALKKSDCKIVLWNIDSQDWVKNLNQNEMLDRIITLSLLWRSGIILFHDTNSKSYNILQKYIKQMQDSNVTFNTNF
ncbi:MAG: polysaccharide deacetylase family protein [Helicobacteraceae bacterium]|nr:polysaccharide deacetylase family protein [Helicobacteraceae bacterium]